MGCDIHGFVEVLHKGEWYAYDKIPLGVRNYALFGLIAGVRNDDVKPVSLPKDIPKDASEVVKLEVKHWGVDGHSHTWLSKTEMKKVYDYMEKIMHKEHNKERKELWLEWGMDSIAYQLYSYGGYFLGENKEYQDVRMIIWFDN